MNPRIRILVVDDSAFARKVLRSCLDGQADLEVVGIARDGLDALEQISALKPDVVTLDLVMPQLDGLGVVKALSERPAGSSPRVIMVSTAESHSELALQALEAGAIDFVHKPTALATERLYELGEELVSKVRTAYVAKTPPRLSPAPLSRERPVFAAGTQEGIVVIGTSTGGPQALARLVPSLPADFPLPVAIALHIPVGYTEGVAKRLNDTSALEVLEAQPGMELKAGRVVLAQAGWHLKMIKDSGHCLAKLDLHPMDARHRPSVDALFESAADVFGPRVLGVVLTGMGSDGLEGARKIRQAGGTIAVEAESSAVVYGMPRSVAEAGLASTRADLKDISELIIHWSGR